MRHIGELNPRSKQRSHITHSSVTRTTPVLVFHHRRFISVEPFMRHWCGSREVVQCGLIRTVWAGLQTNTVEIRYSLLWIALEALFGPEDGGEITHRLSQRIAFFLKTENPATREMFRTAK